MLNRCFLSITSAKGQLRASPSTGEEDALRAGNRGEAYRVPGTSESSSALSPSASGNGNLQSGRGDSGLSSQLPRRLMLEDHKLKVCLGHRGSSKLTWES